MHIIERIKLLLFLCIFMPAFCFATGGKKEDGGPEKKEKSGLNAMDITKQAGIKSGITYTTITINPYPTNAIPRYGRGLLTSGFLTFTAETGTELTIGLGYMNQSSILEVQDSITQDWILDFDYISIPVVLHYPFFYDEFSNGREFKVFTLIGVEFNNVLSAYRDLTQDEEGFVITDNLTNRIHNFEAGITGGAGMSLGITSSVNWIVDGRAFFGLTNFNKNIPLTDASLNMLHTRFQVATGLAVKL